MRRLALAGSLVALTMLAGSCGNEGGENVGAAATEQEAVKAESIRESGESKAGVHPNEKLIREGYAAFNRGDVATVMGLFADDIRFVVPGKSLQAGTFSGKSEVGRYFSILKKHTGGTHSLEIQDVVADDDRVVVVNRALGQHGADKFDMTVVHIWRVEGGKLSELLLFPIDQYAFDEFWS